jgi:hypothetical protein
MDLASPTTIEIAGMTFLLTVGSTDFEVADVFTLTVAADGKMYPFATDGIGGVQNPLMVQCYPVTSTAAGNVSVKPMIAGEVQKQRLVIDADADDSNITAAILDELRSAGITAIDVNDQSVLDNQ